MGILYQSAAGVPPDAISANGVRAMLAENMAYTGIDTGGPLAIV